MKKVLSSLLLASATIMTFGQNIVTETFDALNNGNLGTSVTGNAAGQNSWYTLNGSNSDYQITNIDAAHGKSLTINGYNSFDAANSTLNSRIAAKLTSITATAGNNIVNAAFQLYTGSTTGSGVVSIEVLGTLGTQTNVPIVGFEYNVGTRELKGETVFNTIATGTNQIYTISFAAAPGYILPANSWVTLSCKYDKTTGAVSWTLPGGTASYSAPTSTFNLVPNMVAKDFYLTNATAAGNTVSNLVGFDNIQVQFTNAASLATNEVNLTADAKVKVVVYPNPTTDILNIKSDSKINKVTVVDMTGRNIDVKLENNQVNVQALPVGSYLINIETKDGITTEKFIKK